MTDWPLDTVQFVGGPWDGPGEVHPFSNALYLTVPASPEGYYSVNLYYPDYFVDKEGRLFIRYYWMALPPKAPSPPPRPWWKRFLKIV